MQNIKRNKLIDIFNVKRIAIIQPTMMHLGGADFVIDKLCTELANKGFEVTLFTGDRYNHEFWGRGKPYEIVELKAGEQFYLETLNWEKAGKKLATYLDKFDLINVHNTPSYFYVHHAKKINPNIKAPIIWFCHEPYRFFYRDVTDKHSNQLTIRDVLLNSKYQINGFSEKTNFFKRTRKKIIKYKFRYPIRVIFDNRHRLKLFSKSLNMVFNRNFIRKIDNRIQNIIELDKNIVKTFDLTLCNSSFTADNAKEIYNINALPCTIGHSINNFNQNIKFNKFFLAVSRLDKEKNNFNIIKAVHNLHKKSKLNGFQFVLIGKGGTESREIMEYIDKNRLNEIVKLKGFVSEDEKDKLYREMSFSIYLPFDEPFGLISLESFEYKKPIITSNHGGLSDVVRDKIDGILTDPANIEDIEKSIEFMIYNPETVKEMGEKGYNTLVEKYQFQHFIDRFMNEIENYYEMN